MQPWRRRAKSRGCTDHPVGPNAEPSTRSHHETLRRPTVIGCPAQLLNVALPPFCREAALLRGRTGLRRLSRSPDLERGAERSTSLSTASSRFRHWLRSSCATARKTGPAFATTRRFWRSVRADEASTSKTASTRVSVRCACWPPGPLDREKRSSISRRGDDHAARDANASWIPVDSRAMAAILLDIDASSTSRASRSWGRPRQSPPCASGATGSVLSRIRQSGRGECSPLSSRASASTFGTTSCRRPPRRRSAHCGRRGCSR